MESASPPVWLPRSLAELRQGQLRRLREGLPEVLRSNPFYRARLNDVRGWDDFERLPFTTKAELAADQALHPPFGTDLTHPLDHYVRLHQTSGTAGGRPLRWLDTRASWEWWAKVWAEHVYPAAGIGPQDRVFLAFSFGPFIGFWSAFAGAERLGALAISGASMSSPERVHALQDLGATVLCCTPTYALRLAEAAAAEGVDLARLSLRRTVHAGEPGASVPATRSAIEAAFGAAAFDHTGMTELGPTGASCSQRDGVHLIETELIFEIVDDEGRPATWTGGTAHGELVATNLGRWGSPLVRYRTGDRVEVSRQPCSCGNPFLKVVGGIRGRVDDMLILRGVNVFPSQVEDVVRRHPQVLEFLIECRRLRQMDEATVVVEAGAAADGLTAQIVEELHRALGLRLECRLVPPGTLPRGELKSRRVVRLDA